MNNKFLKELERNYNKEAKMFNFWAGLAMKFNEKAKLAAMRCEQLSRDIEKLRTETVKKIDELSEVEV